MSERKVAAEEVKEGLSNCILIADDDAAVCDVVNHYLSREGYRVEQTTDSKLVIEKVKQLQPFLIFLDIVMPGIDGLDLLRKIKKILPKTHVIMLTGVKDDEVCKEAIELGASSYLTKPFSLEQIKATVLTSLVKAGLKKNV